MKNNKNYIISFDIDGTLLNDKRQISSKDLTTLHKLKKENIVRIAATGRNFYSASKILSSDFPIDFLVFSSGAGVVNWKTKEILYCKHIYKSEITKILNLIKPYNLNFTVHLPIPDNHHMLFYDANPNHEDLTDYTSYYQEFVKPFDFNNIPERATQVIVLLNDSVELFDTFTRKLKSLKTILTTSPINHKSMWMEVFNHKVSKAFGVKQIIDYLSVNNAFIFSIGNDFNDIDMLKSANAAFVVSNAPDELKKQFKVTDSNNNSGFSKAIKELKVI